jgi:hypothetical protein
MPIAALASDGFTAAALTSTITPSSPPRVSGCRAISGDTASIVSALALSLSLCS